MSWSLNIGKVAGTVVRIHLTFLLFLAWIFAASYAASGPATAWDTLAFVVLLFLCVLLHEFGHIFTARAFGVTTPYVTLPPTKRVSPILARPVSTTSCKFVSLMTSLTCRPIAVTGSTPIRSLL